MTAVDLGQLRTVLQGKVIGPGEKGYDDARATWNKNIDQTPAVVVQPRGPADIAAAVLQASRWSMPVAVQSTGHGAVLPCDGAMLIDTSTLTEVRIDIGRKVAQVAPGASWGSTMKAAEEHGLAGRAGFNSTVGVLGYSLGGGYGWLARHHGLASDHIVVADMVLADGSTVRVSADEHADLLWALRGGGGNVGIVTALEFDLVPLDTVYGGTLTFPLDRARELLQLFATTTKDADTRLTTVVRLVRPPADGLLAKLFGGGPTVSVMLCFLGDEADGKLLTRHWLEADPAHGGLGMLKTGDLGSIDGPPPKGAKSVQIGEQLARLDDAAIESLVSRFEPDDSPTFLMELRHIGGAIRASADAAYDRKEGEFLLHLESQPKDEEARDAALEWLDSTRDQIKSVLTDSPALGFIGDGGRGLLAARRAFSEDHRKRMATIKDQVDPENRFPFNIGAAFT